MQSIIKNGLGLCVVMSVSLLAMENLEEKIQDISLRLAHLALDHQESKVHQKKIKKELQNIRKQIPPLKTKGFVFNQLDNKPYKVAVLQRVLDYYVTPAFVSSFSKNFLQLINYGNVVYAISPDRKLFANASCDNNICLWNYPDKKLIDNDLAEHDARVNSIIFSSDNKQIAMGYADGVVKILNCENNEFSIYDHYKDSVSCLAFSSDGKRLASGSVDNSINIYQELVDGSGYHVSRIKTWKKGVLSVAFSPDGSKLAWGSGDSFIGLWDLVNSVLIAKISGHYDSVTSVAFSQDGLMLASGSLDGTIRVWELADNSQLYVIGGYNDFFTFKNLRNIHSIVFRPDNTGLMCKDGGKGLMWTFEGVPFTSFPYINRISDIFFLSNSEKNGSYCEDIDMEKFTHITDSFKEQVLQFLKSLLMDIKGLKKFFLLHRIIESNSYMGKRRSKESMPLDLYQPEAIALLQELPKWVQKPLQDKQMVRVFTKVR